MYVHPPRGGWAAEALARIARSCTRIGGFVGVRQASTQLTQSLLASLSDSALSRRFFYLRKAGRATLPVGDIKEAMFKMSESTIPSTSHMFANRS